MSKQNQQSDQEAETSEREATLEALREAVEYPVFNPTMVPVQIDEDTLHIRGGPWNGPVLTLTDHEEEEVIVRIVDLIDGETHIDDILGSFRHENKGEVARALGELVDKGAIHDAAEYERDEHYHHTPLKPFASVDGFTTDIAVESAAVVATSGLGRHLASDMQTMDLESVTVADPVGGAEIDAGAVSRTDEPIETVVANHDFVVYATERPYPEIEERINEAAHVEDTPWIPVQRIGYDGLVGPTVFPGVTACYECFKSRTLSNVVSWKNYQAYRDAYRNGDVDAETETLPEFNRMLAGMAAMDLRHLFEYGVGYTAGRVVATSSIDLNMHADRVLKQPRCDVCGPDETEQSAPFVNLENFVQTNDPDRYEQR